MKRETVEQVTRALNAAGVPYLAVGGLAVIAHGYGRTTRDIDLVIRLQPAVIEAAFKALAALGYHPRVPITAEGFADPGQRARWIAEKGMRVLSFASDQHPGTAVDVFVTEPFDFQEELGRAMTVHLAPGVPMRIVHLETLLRLKREAGRPQDLADIAELRLLHGGESRG
ncbi:MAG: hypothetical protein WD749_15035 [Phycisphaerales bacterium]